MECWILQGSKGSSRFRIEPFMEILMVNKTLLFLLLFLIGPNISWAQYPFRIKLGIGLNLPINNRPKNIPLNDSWYQLTNPNRPFLKNIPFEYVLEQTNFRLFPFQLGLEISLNDKHNLYFGYSFRYYIQRTTLDTKVSNSDGVWSHVMEWGQDAHHLDFNYSYLVFTTKTNEFKRKTHNIRLETGFKLGFLPRLTPVLIAPHGDIIRFGQISTNRLSKYNVLLSGGISWRLISTQKNKEFLGVLFFMDLGLIRTNSVGYIAENSVNGEIIKWNSYTTGTSFNLTLTIPVYSKKLSSN